MSAVIIIIITAAIMLAAVMIRSAPGCSFGTVEIINVQKREGRIEYIQKLGWEVNADSEEYRKVLLPKNFDGVMQEYAKLQSKQGYDFASYAGLECSQYTYEVKNYPSDDIVYITMFIKNGHVIGGDIHSANIDGFMHALK